MAISDTTIKAAKPKPDKDYKLSDEKGLHILIKTNGSFTLTTQILAS